MTTNNLSNNYRTNKEKANTRAKLPRLQLCKTARPITAVTPTVDDCRDDTCNNDTRSDVTLAGDDCRDDTCNNDTRYEVALAGTLYGSDIQSGPLLALTLLRHGHS